MLPSLYNGISGLQVHSRALAVNADNIANVNTVGFKNSRVSFANVYNRAIGGSAMEFGQGVDIAGVTSQWNSGSFQTTANALDLAIGGRGMFTLANPDVAAAAVAAGDEVDENERFYTRDGQFKFDSEGYMVALNGMVVLGDDGEPIFLGGTVAGAHTDANVGFYPFNPLSTSQIVSTSFNRDGELLITLADGNVVTPPQRLGLTDFADYTALAKEGRNIYSSTPNAGQLPIDAPGEVANGLIAPGSLEMSNTDLATEFVAMISMQRGFQANSKTITTADQVLEVLMTVKR